MTITLIEALPRNKNKVYIDGTYMFMLYTRELGIYGLDEGCDIDGELYDRIISDTVLKRARQRALELLERSDKSENEIRRKLRTDLYNDAVIDDTVKYLYGFHYLDDRRVAGNYIRYHSAGLSSFELKQKLLQKGIDKELIAELIDEYVDAEGDKVSALGALRKKLNGRTSLSRTDKQKAIAYMMRKGFKLNDIFDSFEQLNIEITNDDFAAPY